MPIPAPVFDLQGGAAVVLCRATADAMLLALVGNWVFRRRVLPRLPVDNTASIARSLDRFGWLCVAGGVLFHSFWLVLQSAAMVEATNWGAAFGAVPLVLSDSRFGRLIAAQLLFLPLLGLLSASNNRAGWLAAAVCIGLQLGHSHVASMAPLSILLLLTDWLHLMAAAGWLGGLVPLLLVVARCPPKVGAQAARWFSPYGKLCVVVVMTTALIQGVWLIGSPAALMRSAYGWIALLKLALFTPLSALACLNRYRLAPALMRLPVAKRRLIASVVLQTFIGLALVAAAAMLTNLPPPMQGMTE